MATIIKVKNSLLKKTRKTKKVTRAKKNFVVVAYDIVDDRRRNKVAKILGKFGTRVNYSVFECMLTDKEFEKLRTDIEKKIDVKEDGIAYYPICLKCYTKIKYRLPYERVHEKVTVV